MNEKCCLRGIIMSNEEHILSNEKPDCFFFRASTDDFKKIPGNPIAYWVSEKFLGCFTENPAIGDQIALKAGMSTGDNTIFQRAWYEVAMSNISFLTSDNNETKSNGTRWYPCHSGGEYRKWYGNHDVVVNWYQNGAEIRNFGLDKGKQKSAVRNEFFYFKSGITWSKISSGRCKYSTPAIREIPLLWSFLAKRKNQRAGIANSGKIK